MNKEDLLKAALDAVTVRGSAYGDAYTNHKRIADLWSVILQTKVRPDQVAPMMISVKLARLVETPDHEDSYVDMAGYAATGSQVKDDEKLTFNYLTNNEPKREHYETQKQFNARYDDWAIKLEEAAVRENMND
jgi:hypothetical protein